MDDPRKRDTHWKQPSLQEFEQSRTALVRVLPRTGKGSEQGHCEVPSSPKSQWREAQSPTGHPTQHEGPCASGMCLPLPGLSAKQNSGAPN